MVEKLSFPNKEETTSLHLDTYGKTPAECDLCTEGDALLLIKLDDDGGVVLRHERHVTWERMSKGGESDANG